MNQNSCADCGCNFHRGEFRGSSSIYGSDGVDLCRSCFDNETRHIDDAGTNGITAHYVKRKQASVERGK
jgi:hypothetical protein